jgi:peptide deformylase
VLVAKAAKFALEPALVTAAKKGAREVQLQRRPFTPAPPFPKTIDMPLKIAQLGQPVLRRVAAEVPRAEILSPDFQRFLQEMHVTLRAGEGAGLAAPQVYSSRRVFLAAILPPLAEDAPPEVEIFINPRLVRISEETAGAWEGCLSFPELLVFVPRLRRVRIEYLDARGEPRVLDLDGFPARVVQHEFDHLEGILTIDRAPTTRHIIKASEAEAVLRNDEPDA